MNEATLLRSVILGFPQRKGATNQQKAYDQLETEAVGIQQVAHKTLVLRVWLPELLVEFFVHMHVSWVEICHC